MRTHRLKITCNNEDAASFIEDNILHDDFCDLTHWYCGFDGAGEDTPDECIIYRGTIQPNVVYVEFDIGRFNGKTADVIADEYKSMKRSFRRSHRKEGWEILDVDCNELSSYKKIKELKLDRLGSVRRA